LVPIPQEITLKLVITCNRYKEQVIQDLTELYELKT